MALEVELAAFDEILHKLIDYTMVTDMTDAVEKEMEIQIVHNVYEKIVPRVYERKWEKHGLLDLEKTPIGNLDINYDSNLMLLTVENVRPDWEPTSETHYGRNVAEVVESGSGYDWRKIGPRPFHKPTEDALINTGEADRVLQKALDESLAGDIWSI